MLSTLRNFAVQRVLAIVLIAVCSFVGVERAQAMINDVQHELSIAHDDPAAELAATLSTGGLDNHHDGDNGIAGDDAHPGAHHHHSEGPQVANLANPGFTGLALSGSEAAFAWADSGSPRSATFGLDRPPKA